MNRLNRFLDDETDARAARWIVAIVVTVLALTVVHGMARGDLPGHDRAYVTTIPSPVANPAEPTPSAAAPHPSSDPSKAGPSLTIKGNADTSPVKSAPPVATGRSLSPAQWYAMADCESGDWDRDGNPIAGTARWDDQRDDYEGGLHFLNATWLDPDAGGGQYAQHAYDATAAQQIEVAARWLSKTSLAQWPACSRKIGAR